MRGRGEWDNVDVGDGCTPGLGIMLDVVLLLVELALPEEIVDGLVVLQETVNMLVLNDVNLNAQSRGTGPPSCTANLWS